MELDLQITEQQLMYHHFWRQLWWAQEDKETWLHLKRGIGTRHFKKEHSVHTFLEHHMNWREPASFWKRHRGTGKALFSQNETGKSPLIFCVSQKGIFPLMMPLEKEGAYRSQLCVFIISLISSWMIDRNLLQTAPKSPAVQQSENQNKFLGRKGAKGKKPWPHIVKPQPES